MKVTVTLPDATTIVYGKKFNQFFIKLDRKPTTWEDRIILFAGYLIDEKKKSTTVRSYVSAIKYILAEDGVFINENKFLLTSLTRACKLINDKVRTRLLIQKGLLIVLLSTAKNHFLTNNQPFLHKLYSALFTSAYYGLLRVGELTVGPHAILARDVRIGRNKDKVLFILRTSKTHWQDSKPQLVKLARDERKDKNKRYEHCLRTGNSKEAICPFKIIRTYASA